MSKAERRTRRRRTGKLRANPLHRSPIHLLHRAGQCAGDIFQAEVQIGDLTPRQLAVLVTLSESEGLSQTGIHDRTGINQARLTDIMRRMERKKYLQRRRLKEDARAYSVTLTDKGRRVLRTAEPLARKVDERVLGALPSPRRALFVGALLSIVAHLGV